jgi:predicted MFS family arabinose efflux permease
MQAYLGDRVRYQRRGRVLAITEMSWSLSFILLVPLAGLLIARLGWTAPFWMLLGLGLAGLALIAWRVPADGPSPNAGPQKDAGPLEDQRQNTFWHTFGKVLTNPSALAALSVSMMITLANELVNLVFGVWIGDTFHLEIASLGLAATVIGVAELGGEAATAMLVDRIGKKRAVRAGIIFTSLAALGLPVLGFNLGGALVGLFLFYLGFEFTIVSYIPLMTEVLPQARATLMAVNLAAFSLGRALGALAGPWLYAAGFGANALAALALNGLALLALSRVRVDD